MAARVLGTSKKETMEARTSMVGEVAGRAVLLVVSESEGGALVHFILFIKSISVKPTDDT